MKVRITGRGLYGANGVETPIGTEVTVPYVPKGWHTRCEVIEDDSDKTMVVNPSEEEGQEDLMKVSKKPNGKKTGQRK